MGRFGKPGRSNHSRKGATYSPPASGRWYPSRWSGPSRSHESPAGAFSEGPTMPCAASSGSWLCCLRASHRIVPPRNDTANCVCAAPRRIFFVAPKKQNAFRCGGDEGRLERYGFLPFGSKDRHARHRSYCLRRGGVYELFQDLQRIRCAPVRTAHLLSVGYRNPALSKQRKKVSCGYVPQSVAPRLIQKGNRMGSVACRRTRGI